MATVRIYKVAELLNTTSQEVMALLKRDHGIDVKSASSTIEEVVGRQLVDRPGPQRGGTLPRRRTCVRWRSAPATAASRCGAAMCAPRGPPPRRARGSRS